MVDPGLQRSEWAFVSLVERIKRFVQNGEEGRAINYQEVVAATSACPQRNQATHNFGSVDGGVFMPEPSGESTDDWECKGLRYRVVVRVLGEGATVGCEGGAMGMSVAPITEHTNISVLVGGACSVQQSRSPIVGGVVRVFPRGGVPVLGRVRDCAGGLEDAEFLGPVVLRVEYGEPDGFLETEARDAGEVLGVT